MKFQNILLIFLFLTSCGYDYNPHQSASSGRYPYSDTFSISEKISFAVPKIKSADKSDTIPAWSNNASKGWIGYHIFKVFADQSDFDPDFKLWSLENLENWMDLTTSLFSNVQVYYAYDEGITYARASNLNYKINRVAYTSSNTPFTIGSFPEQYFTDSNPFMSFDKSADITFPSLGMNVNLVWSHLRDLFYFRNTEYKVDETTYTDFQYVTNNDSRGTLNRATLTPNLRTRIKLTISYSDGYPLKLIQITNSQYLSIAAVKKRDGVFSPSGSASYYFYLKVIFNPNGKDANGAITRYFCIDKDDTTDVDFTAFYNSNNGTLNDYTPDGNIQMVADFANFKNKCADTKMINTLDRVGLFTEKDIPETSTLWDKDHATLNL